MARDWERYYDERMLDLGPQDFLQQVGHTVGGIPISDGEFNLLLDQIKATLDLAPQDRLLDLCCGNGLFTVRLAQAVESAVGVDISRALISVAESEHGAPNLRYFQKDIRELGDLADLLTTRFNKIVIYAAAQHFAPSEFEAALAQVIEYATDDCVLLVGFVPSRKLKWRFYDTPRRRVVHVLRTITGRDTFGTWWSDSDFEELAARLGFEAELESVCPGLHASNYRMNAVLRRRT